MRIAPATLDFRDCHHLLAGAIVPRPITLISTIGEDGVYNVAPFSSINVASVKPALVVFSISTLRQKGGSRKDTIRNIEFSKEFVVNIPVTESIAQAMNKSSTEYPSDVDEFKETGLTPVKAAIVKAPMVAETPVNFECRVVQILDFGELPSISNLVIGEVVLAHVDDEFYVDGEIQAGKMNAIGRLLEPYCRTRDTFEIEVEYTL